MPQITYDAQHNVRWRAANHHQLQQKHKTLTKNKDRLAEKTATLLSHIFSLRRYDLERFGSRWMHVPVADAEARRRCRLEMTNSTVRSTRWISSFINHAPLTIVHPRRLISSFPSLFFFVSGPCARLSWPGHLVSFWAHVYRIVSYRMSLITSKQVRMSAIKTPLMGLSDGVTFLPVHLTDCLADVVLLAQDNQGIMSGSPGIKI